MQTETIESAQAEQPIAFQSDGVDDLPGGRRRMVARIVRSVGWVSINLGLFLIGFVVHAVFITTFFAERNQVALAEERVANFDSAVIEEVEWTPLVSGADLSSPISEGVDVSGSDTLIDSGDGVPLIIERELPPAKGEAFALIRIPSIESLAQGWNVVEGTSVADLRNGAGHMAGTPLPGQPGNAVISGHRTTYGAPFRDLDLLEIGDIIEVETALGVHTYMVRETLIVAPTDVWVTDNRTGAWLTLTTCNPRFSSRERLIIFAELISGPNAEVILGSL